MKIQSSIKPTNNIMLDTNDIILRNMSFQNKNQISNDSTFESILSQNITSTFDLQLNELLSKIDSQKDKLIKNRNITELRKYKSLICDFFQIINNKLNLKEQVYYDTLGKKRVLTNIDNINSKLENLTSEFLKDNKNDINIVNLVDEVKGLLIDSII